MRLGRRPLTADAAILRPMVQVPGRFVALRSGSNFWSHASWDGDAYSTLSTTTLLDMSTFTNAPADTSHIKAYLLGCSTWDSGTFGSGAYWFACGPESINAWSMFVCIGYGGDLRQTLLSVVPCSPAGDLYYRMNASGASTLKVILRVWGYFI